MVEDGLIVQAGVRAVELRLDEAQRLLGHVGPLVEHGDQLAVSHHAGAGHFLSGAGVNIFQGCAVRRRPENPRVEHSGKSEVAGVLGFPGDLFEGILAAGRFADDGERRHGLYRHFLEMAFDALALNQLRVGDALVRRQGVGDYAGLHLQPLGRCLELLGGHLEKDRPGFGSGRAHDGAQIPDAHGAERAHVVGAEVSVAHHHVHGVEGDVQLLGEELCQCGHGPLAQFHLADETGDPALGADAKVGVEIGGTGLAAGQPGRLLEGVQIDPEEYEQARAGHGEEIAASHSAPPFTAPAASWMASTMRTCAPQRHKLSSMCWRIWARVGWGVLSNSA